MGTSDSMERLYAAAQNVPMSFWAFESIALIEDHIVRDQAGQIIKVVSSAVRLFFQDWTTKVLGYNWETKQYDDLLETVTTTRQGVRGVLEGVNFSD